MRIGIITNEAFPNGMATTNRIISLAKGLIQENITVKVYCIRPTENRQKQMNFEKKGIHEKIEFEYTNNSIIWPAGKIKKAIVKTIGVLQWIIKFYKDIQKKKFDVIISTTTPLISNLFFFFFAKLTKTKLAVTTDEFPIFVRNPKNKTKLFQNIYLQLYPNLFSGFIVMTKTLINYWKNYTNSHTKFIHIPMTVDIERFTKDLDTPKLIQDKACITYCGNLGHNEKDGVPILISSFAIIVNKGFNFYLVIIGHAKQSEQKQLENLQKQVSELNIVDRVIFTGKVNKDYIPNYLNNSEFLALARPNNKQAQGGFPTKLGEYLASKRPVIVTKVGEIPNYLNKSNAYLSEPDSVEFFTNALEKAILDPEKNNVGTNGFKTAVKYFNYKQYSKKLKLFLEDL